MKHHLNLIISIFFIGVLSICTPIHADAVTYKTFDISYYNSDPDVMDMNLGISGYVVEDFEDNTLTSGLSISSGNYPILPNTTWGQSWWDGTHVLNLYGTNLSVTFSIPASTSFGIGLSEFDPSYWGTQVSLEVNGVAVGPQNLLTDPNYSENLQGRNMYIVISADPGSTINEVRFNITTLPGSPDGVFFDHLAYVYDPQITYKTWYADNDGDGYGDPSNSVDASDQPFGYVSDNTDCNDMDKTVYPGALDNVVNGIDNDCDGAVDEDASVSYTTWYYDSDGDGYGDINSAIDSDTAPVGYIADNTDCDDSDGSIYPGAAEIADDGIDQDCNGGDLSGSAGGGNATVEPMVEAGDWDSVGIKSDGTILNAGGLTYAYGQGVVSNWNSIKQVSVGVSYIVGLYNNGTAVSFGTNDNGEGNVSQWADIIQVDVGGHYSYSSALDADTEFSHTAGLKSDGTVVAVGDNSLGQCNVSPWNGVKQVSAGGGNTVALKTDGTVVLAGEGYSGVGDISSWTDIKQISANRFHVVGLKTNGSVVAAGEDSKGRCDVDSWTNIKQISAGMEHTVGLKTDGTVVAVGSNSYGQCNVDTWTDIKQIAAGGGHTIGLKFDGTVIAVGNNNGPFGWSYFGQCDVSSWNLGTLAAGNTWYMDADGDGYGDPNNSVDSSSQPTGYVSDNTDCDDNQASVNPGAAEIDGDGIDNDCNGTVDNAGSGTSKISLLSPSNNESIGYGSTGGKVTFSFSKLTDAAKYILHIKLDDILTDLSIDVPVELIPPGTSSSNPWGGNTTTATPGFSEQFIGMVFELTLDSATWDVLALYDMKWGVEAYNDTGVLIGSTYLGSTAEKYVNSLKFMASNAIAMTGPLNGTDLDKSDPAPVFQWSTYQGAVAYTLILAHVGSLGFDSVISQPNLTLNLFPMDDATWQTMPTGTWYWTVVGYDALGVQTPNGFTIFNFEVQ